MTRTQRQDIAIARWKAAGAKGAWAFATGFGKTYTALKVIQLVQAKNPASTTNIVVPTIFLQMQFHAALAKAQLQNVEVFVINTYVREARRCDLLIADEVHLFLGEHAEQFPKLFTSLCQHAWVLALSATLTEAEQERLALLGIPVCDTISLKEAQDNGWVARCKTYNLAVRLSPEEQLLYDRHNDIFQSSFARFGHDFQLAMNCVSNSDARKAYAERMGWIPEAGKEDRWSPQTLGSAANQWLKATHGRQQVVNTASAKYHVAQQLCEKFPVKALCFSESTIFASELARRMPSICKAYHSQVQSATEEYTTTKTFKNKPDEISAKTRRVSGTALCSRAVVEFADANSLVRVLSAARALDQGADFAGLQLGIETSGNSSIRQKVQRTGRVVRQEAGSLEEKLAVYVHVFCSGTYEANKLKRKQRGIAGIIETANIQDITL